MLHGEEFSLFSVTRLCSDDTRMQNLMSTEFLNSLRSPGVPEHELKLTVYGDKKHLGPGLANEQHQGHRERDRPTPGHRRHTCSRGRAKRAL